MVAETKISDGYKQTEVGVIPEDWGVQSMRAIGSVIRGASPRPQGDKRYYGGNVPRLMVEDITRDKHWVTPSVDFLTEEGAKLSRLCRKGSLVVVCSGTPTAVGLPALLAIDACIHDGILGLVQIDEQIDEDFLFHQLQSLQKRLHASATHGGTFVNLTTDGFSSFKIAIPPTKEEQTAIASALSEFDSLISKYEGLIAKKQNIKQGAMQELLTGRKRLEGFSGEWEQKKLSDLANIFRGASPRPIDDPKWFDESSGIGWVRIYDVTQSRKYLYRTTQNLSIEGMAASRFVGKDNLIMSICATVGRPILTKKDTCIHDGFVVFEGLKADKEFLYYYLSSIEYQWSRHGQIGSQMNLNTTIIENEKVPIPKESQEQTAIAQILSDMDTEIEALEGKLEKYRAVKQGMMQELLTGKTRLI